MKDVVILSYEGNVKVEFAPKCTKREDIIDCARMALQGKLGKSLASLNNVRYMTENEYSKFIMEHEERDPDFREFFEEDMTTIQWGETL